MKNRVNFDDYTKQYEELLAKQLSFFGEDTGYFAEYKVELSRKLIGESCQRVLDFGCGIGRSIPHFRNHFTEAEIYGCDLSVDSLEFCKRNYPYANFYFTDQLPSEIKYDLIFAAGVWHHVPVEERRAALHLCRNLLMPGGAIIIFEHNPYNPVTRRMVSTCEFDADAVLLTRRELVARMQEAGFVGCTTGYTLFFPSKLKALRRMEGWMKRIPLGGQYYVKARRDC